LTFKNNMRAYLVLLCSTAVKTALIVIQYDVPAVASEMSRCSFFLSINEASEGKLEANWYIGQLNVGTFTHALRLAQAPPCCIDLQDHCCWELTHTP
jgi:hypothetical protein